MYVLYIIYIMYTYIHIYNIYIYIYIYNIYNIQRADFVQLLNHLGQQVIGKFMKLSKIGFYMERFVAKLSRFYRTKCQNLLFG